MDTETVRTNSLPTTNASGSRSELPPQTLLMATIAGGTSEAVQHPSVTGGAASKTPRNKLFAAEGADTEGNNNNSKDDPTPAFPHQQQNATNTASHHHLGLGPAAAEGGGERGGAFGEEEEDVVLAAEDENVEIFQHTRKPLVSAMKTQSSFVPTNTSDNGGANYETTQHSSTNPITAKIHSILASFGGGGGNDKNKDKKNDDDEDDDYFSPKNNGNSGDGDGNTAAGGASSTDSLEEAAANSRRSISFVGITQALWVICFLVAALVLLAQEVSRREEAFVAAAQGTVETALRALIIDSAAGANVTSDGANALVPLDSLVNFTSSVGADQLASELMTHLRRGKMSSGGGNSNNGGGGSIGQWLFASGVAAASDSLFPRDSGDRVFVSLILVAVAIALAAAGAAAVSITSVFKVGRAMADESQKALFRLILPERVSDALSIERVRKLRETARKAIKDLKRRRRMNFLNTHYYQFGGGGGGFGMGGGTDVDDQQMDRTEGASSFGTAVIGDGEEGVNDHTTKPSAANSAANSPNPKSQQLVVSSAPSFRMFPSLYSEFLPVAWVAFMDVVGFTMMCRGTSSNTVIQVLNELISIIDSLAEDFKIEKIKTIGDAYMCAKLSISERDLGTIEEEMAEKDPRLYRRYQRRKRRERREAEEAQRLLADGKGGKGGEGAGNSAAAYRNITAADEDADPNESSQQQPNNTNGGGENENEDDGLFDEDGRFRSEVLLDTNRRPEPGLELFCRQKIVSDGITMIRFLVQAVRAAKSVRRPPPDPRALAMNNAVILTANANRNGDDEAATMLGTDTGGYLTSHPSHHNGGVGGGHGGGGGFVSIPRANESLVSRPNTFGTQSVTGRLPSNANNGGSVANRFLSVGGHNNNNNNFNSSRTNYPTAYNQQQQHHRHGASDSPPSVYSPGAGHLPPPQQLPNEVPRTGDGDEEGGKGGGISSPVAKNNGNGAGAKNIAFTLAEESDSDLTGVIAGDVRGSSPAAADNNEVRTFHSNATSSHNANANAAAVHVTTSGNSPQHTTPGVLSGNTVYGSTVFSDMDTAGSHHHNNHQNNSNNNNNFGASRTSLSAAPPANVHRIPSFNAVPSNNRRVHPFSSVSPESTNHHHHQHHSEAGGGGGEDEGVVGGSDVEVEAEPEFPPYLEMRAGLHVGPVASGIVGFERPLYDLFGDTVNTAARLESNGQKATVHILASTADLLLSTPPPMWMTRKGGNIAYTSATTAVGPATAGAGMGGAAAFGPGNISLTTAAAGVGGAEKEGEAREFTLSIPEANPTMAAKNGGGDGGLRSKLSNIFSFSNASNQPSRKGTAAPTFASSAVASESERGGGGGAAASHRSNRNGTAHSLSFDIRGDGSGGGPATGGAGGEGNMYGVWDSKNNPEFICFDPSGELIISLKGIGQVNTLLITDYRNRKASCFTSDVTMSQSVHHVSLK